MRPKRRVSGFPKSGRTALLLQAVLLTVSCFPGDEHVTSAAEMVAVSRLMVTFDRLAAAGDADGMANLFTDDAVLMPPNEPAIVGKRLIRKRFEEQFGRAALALDHEPLEVDASGRFIVHRGRAVGSVRPSGGGPLLKVDDKYLFVLRTEQDGSLRIWRAIYNSNISTAGDRDH